MNDFVLILMYVAIVGLMIGSPLTFYKLWKADKKRIEDVLAYNKWYREERLRLIKEHKIELLALQKKRVELEIKWQLEYDDKRAAMAAEIDAKFNKRGV